MFCNDLRGKLRANRITQKELADYLGVGKNSVYSWVNGRVFPTGRNLDRILELFDMRKDDYNIEIINAKRKRANGAKAGTAKSTLQEFDSVKLAEMIGKSGLTRKFIAKEIGVSEASLSNWERGVNKPTLNKLEKLNQYFSVTNDFWKKDHKSTFIPKERLDPKIKGKVDLSENPYRKKKNDVKPEPKPEKLEFDKEPFHCDMEIKSLKKSYGDFLVETDKKFENVARLLNEQDGTNHYFADTMKEIDERIAELEEKITYIRGLIDGAYTDKPELEEKSWWKRLWS